MFKTAYKHTEEVVFLFDIWGNKHVVTGGTLAWRIRNPGLIHKRTRAAILNGAIGSFDLYAIFSEPEQGIKALADWLNSKTCQNTTLQEIAKHYRQGTSHNFLKYIIEIVGVAPTKKVGALSKSEFQKLKDAICKLCGYTYVGNENSVLLPKITAKIENINSKEDSYLIAGNIVLSKKETIDRILSHQIDAIIVHEQSGNIHVRSRPHHHMQHVRVNENKLLPSEGQLEVISRSVGEKKLGQCIWAYINGISNTKKEALESAMMISTAAKGEMVLSMPNDQILWGIGNLIASLIKKCFIDTPIVKLAVKFFRYLLQLSEDDPMRPPIIVFVHSQGAIIAEHALEHLKPGERNNLRIFTFGGGSFVSPEKCHPDSHNYASANDLIPKMGSYSLQDAGLLYYFLSKKGKTREQIIDLLVERDSMLCSDSEIFSKPKIWFQVRKKYYEEVFNMHITIVEPENLIEHGFKNDCYQTIVKNIVQKYQER